MSLLDPNWKYTHSTATDIRKTFAKARRELARKALTRVATRPKHGTTRPNLKLVTEQPSTESGKTDALAITPAGQ